MKKDTKHRALHRAKIIKGQLDGLEKESTGMLTVWTVLTQSLAIQKSLASLSKLMVSHHIETHIQHMLASSDEKQEKAVAELSQLYELTNVREIMDHSHHHHHDDATGNERPCYLSSDACEGEISKKLSKKVQFVNMTGRLTHIAANTVSKFNAHPEEYVTQDGHHLEHGKHPAQYVCPMHPEATSDKPGMCPKCHMALEKTKKAAQPQHGHNHTEHDKHAGHSPNMFKQKFWLSLLLTVPTLLFSHTVQGWLGIELMFPLQRIYTGHFWHNHFLFYGGLVFSKVPGAN